MEAGWLYGRSQRRQSRGAMPVREAEAIILRTYALREADKLVSFFSREGGRTRGVAPNARRSLRRFGSGLEPLSYVRLRYVEQEGRDLVRLESCELLQSFFEAQSSYEVAVASSYIAEVCEQLLPEHEANDPFFRLVLLVMSEIRRTGQIWRPLSYFDLWAVQLAGFLPPLEICFLCRAPLEPGTPAWFRVEAEGLLCSLCRSQGCSQLSADSRRVAHSMLRNSLPTFAEEGWNKESAADLRQFLGQRIERHLERKLMTRSALESLP
ncbi:MAG: DNA repair protein RecO [Acidobacteria bacterium]|nr:DNA repair protein RecO [Acidobacteriota bacterium]